MRGWRGVSVLAAAFLSACSGSPYSPFRQATGASAQTLCNAVFVSRLDPRTTLREELHREPGMPLIDWALDYHIDHAGRAVRASIAGVAPSRAVYVDGRGCTLMFGAAALPATLRSMPAQAPLLPEIAGPAVVSPMTRGLADAIDAGFAESGRPGPRGTKAIVVVHRGRVVGERYADGITATTPLNSHSLAKSVVNALIGVLVRDGKLALGQRIEMPADKSGGRSIRFVTIEQLLRMTAGMGFDEGVRGAVASHIWYEEADTARASLASAARSSAKPNWGYCNRCYSILSRVAGDAVGGGPDGLNRYMEAELFGPLGMRNVVPEFDQAGTLMGANAIFASARDFARFGLLYANDGVVGGHRILPEDWVTLTASRSANTGYGAGFWLNVTQGPMPEWSMNWGLPHAPHDTFFARGYLGQYIVIVPSSDLVIVRLGQSHGGAGELESVGKLTGKIVEEFAQHSVR